MLSSNQSNKEGREIREIRKIPSKKAVTGKKKRIQKQEQPGEIPFPSGTDMNNPKILSGSIGKNKPRHSSHTNRMGQKG